MYDYLITGGKGFIGRNLVDRLDQENKVYKIVDIEGYDDPSCSVLDASFRLPKIEADTLVHLAAETNVRDSIKSPRHYFDRNCSGTINCLELIREKKVKKVIFTSSASSESAESPYLASKLAGEAICKAYEKSYGLDVKILKLSSVYGPYSIHKKSVIARFIKACINHEALTIFGSGQQKRDFVFVGDVVDAIIHSRSGYISTGVATSISWLAHKISQLSIELLGYQPLIHHELAVAGEVIDPILNSDLPSFVSLESGLRTTFKWFVRNYEPKRMERSRSR